MFILSGDALGAPVSSYFRRQSMWARTPAAFFPAKCPVAGTRTAARGLAVARRLQRLPGMILRLIQSESAQDSKPTFEKALTFLNPSRTKSSAIRRLSFIE